MSLGLEIVAPRRALALLAQNAVSEDTTLSASFTPEPVWGASVLTGYDLSVGVDSGHWCTGLFNLGGAYGQLTLFHRQTAADEKAVLYSWRGEMLVPSSTYLEWAVACDTPAALGILAWGYSVPEEQGFVCTPF